MAHRAKNDNFIAQGLRWYPEARATVHAFESALAGRIEKCIARRNWRAWKPDAEGFEPDYNNRSEWNWVGVAATGRMTHRGTKTDLWDTTDRVVHRTFRLESWPRPVWNRDLPLPKITGGTAVRQDGAGFYLISDSPDLDRIFARLLAKFDACAAAAARPKKR
jgi:hypothetical protein